MYCSITFFYFFLFQFGETLNNHITINNVTYINFSYLVLGKHITLKAIMTIHP